VLAEQGAIGLAAWLLLLGSVLASTLWRLPRASPRDRSLAIGLLAFVVTWLTGHPMLVPEAAFMFWLLIGILAATLPAPGGGGWVWMRRVLAGAAILLVATIPVRTASERRAADLEHRGIALSVWHHEGEMRYREGGASFSIYLPADTEGVLVPIRLAPGVLDPVRLEIRVEETLVNAVTLAGPDWQTLRLRLPDTGNRFERADFTAVPTGDGPPAGGVLLHVGRAQPIAPAGG
jgi:hypothetical protein